MAQDGHLWSLKFILESAGEDLPNQEDATVEQLIEETSDKPQDARARVQEMKKQSGAMKLAPKLLTHRNLFFMRCMMAVCCPIWTCFTERMTQVKMPMDSMRFWLMQSKGQWIHELIGCIKNVCHNTDTFSRLEIWSRADGAQERVELAMSLLLHICSNRLKSIFTQLHEPPYRYAGALERGPGGQAVVTQMQQEWQNLLQLEAGDAQEPALHEPVQMMKWRHNMVPRLLYLAFEKGDWKVEDLEAQGLLANIFTHLPDSKVIEDLHNHLRDLSRKAGNHASGAVSRQIAILESQVLESRGIPTMQMLPEEMAQRQSASLTKGFKKLTEASRHKPHPDMQQLMHPATPDSVSPAYAFQTIAATSWCFHHSKEKLDCALNVAWLSVLMPERHLVMRKSSNEVYLVMASSPFACLLWPMKQIADGRFGFSFEGVPVQWGYVLDLEEWAVLLAQAEAPEEHASQVGITFQAKHIWCDTDSVKM